MQGFKVPVGISNKHVHVSQADLDILFGEGHELTKLKDLKQLGQYACEEKIDIVGPKGTLKGIRILGPVRPETQIEVSVGDARALGVSAPVRDSGDLDGSPGVKVVGPKGEITLKQGVIVASRHIHMNSEDAAKGGFKDKDIVNIKIEGKRGLVLNNVLIRVNDAYALEFHIDTEEANAAQVANEDDLEII